MNKAELIAAVAEKAELTKKDAEKAVNAFVETVEGALKKDDKVQMVGFGSFEVRKRAARKGRNRRRKRDHDPRFQGSCVQGWQGFQRQHRKGVIFLLFIKPGGVYQNGSTGPFLFHNRRGGIWGTVLI